MKEKKEKEIKNKRKVQRWGKLGTFSCLQLHLPSPLGVELWHIFIDKELDLLCPGRITIKPSY